MEAKEQTEQSKREIAILEATESLAEIIDSTSPQNDLSTVIVNAIAEGNIPHINIQY